MEEGCSGGMPEGKETVRQAVFCRAFHGMSSRHADRTGTGTFQRNAFDLLPVLCVSDLPVLEKQFLESVPERSLYCCMRKQNVFTVSIYNPIRTVRIARSGYAPRVENV